MSTIAAPRQSSFRRKLNGFQTYISKPQNAILLALGIILTITTVFPMITIVRDTVSIHPGSVDADAKAQDAQVEVLGEAYYGTHELMDNGKANYLEVLTAQESLLSAQLNEAMNMYNGAQAVIALYIALGGATN